MWRQLGRMLAGSFVMALVLVICLSGLPARAAELELKAKGAILMDAATGQVLWEQNPDVRWYPASMTKVMTMMLVLEAVEQGKLHLQDQVVASEHAASFGGTQVWLEPGETFTVEEMLKAVAVGSANDCSVALAEHLAGSEEAFVEMMNAKAAALGATNTHFTNSHGLPDPNHYTTPRDMAIMARYALRFPDMLRLTSIKEYTFREEPKLLILYNTNKLLWWYPGSDGLKTGTTSEAGRNLCATASREGLRLIAVVMGVDEPRGHFSEAIKLLNYGFAQYTFKEFYPAGAAVSELAVDKGAADRVLLVASERVGAAVPKGEAANLQIDIRLPDSIPAPVAKGQPLGQAVIKAGGDEIHRVNLVAAADVPAASLGQQIRKVLVSIFSI